MLNKWRGLHFEQGIHVEQLVKIGLVVLFLFVLFFYWLFRLKREILQRKQVEQALQVSERRFRKIFEGTDAISVQGYNKDHQVIYWNHASEMLYGYSAVEAMGKKLEELIILDEMQAQVRTAINDWVNGGPGIPSSEMTLKKADGKPVHVFSSYVMHKNQSNEPEIYCIDIDNTLRKEQADKIEHQAYFDNLTDLPNRMLALDRLNQLLNEAKRNSEKVAVLFLDLDDFKKINDTLGHEVGDKLLIEVAERLSSVLRAGDTVGRLGGDEFILLLGGLSHAEEAQPIAENLLCQFRNPFRIESRELIMTSSIGISIYPEDASDSSRLLRNADSAMYHAKEQGRNIYSYFTDSMNREVSRRLALEEQIHGALERNEFEVFYQPKIDINNGKVVAAEALLRWNNPVLGNVSPVEFIPICEQTSLIINIGKFVLVEALRQTLQWQKNQCDDFYIAVNLSPRQFRDPKLVPGIEEAIKQAGISPNSLELEITEGVLMSGHSYIDEALTQLSRMGITIAMDDFGTGYSSLSYLRSYPFNIIKIDRSFVNDVTVDPADRELINATIVMAHALNLKVVAEGVETQEQLEHLIQMNCDIAQGYLYSKPVSASDFTQLLESECA
ncbi:MAG: EAL domain-containing protein [Gammaproteobacteria bacterium]|nr:EAL domain-containing protein [Gammaproteobacteria bacterium]